MITAVQCADTALSSCAPSPKGIRPFVKSAARGLNESIRESALSARRRAAAVETAPAAPVVPVDGKNKTS